MDALYTHPMSSSFHSRLRAAAWVLAVTVFILAAGRHFRTAVRAQEGPTVWNGVYTKEQANRGRGLYRTNCAACHGDRPTGTAMAPALTGGDFMAAFVDLTVGDLFTKIMKTMPTSSPGILTGAETSDLIAFLALSNEWPTGEKELPVDPEELKQVRIVRK